jgi:hypothetical protein
MLQLLCRTICRLTLRVQATRFANIPPLLTTARLGTPSFTSLDPSGRHNQQLLRPLPLLKVHCSIVRYFSKFLFIDCSWWRFKSTGAQSCHALCLLSFKLAWISFLFTNLGAIFLVYVKAKLNSVFGHNP